MAKEDDFRAGRGLASTEKTGLGARLGNLETSIGPSEAGYPFLPSYVVAEVPDATVDAGGMIFVTDETGGAVPAFSDGTNWRRCTDRAIVS